MQARWAAALAVTLTLLGLVAVLAQSRAHLSGSNDIGLTGFVAELAPGQTGCQVGESVPADTGRLQLFAGAFGRPGPPLVVSWETAGAQVETRVGGGYADGDLTVAVPPIVRDRPGPVPLNLCLRNTGTDRVALGGRPWDPGGALQVEGRPAEGRLRLVWLTPDERSWAVLAPTIARRMGYGTTNAFEGGTWAVVLLLVVATWAMALVALLRPPRRAWTAVAALALLNAAAWSLLTPPFHVPDEPQHLAYTQYLAETGQLPGPEPGDVYSAEEAVTTDAIQLNQVIGNPLGRPAWTVAEDRGIDERLAAPIGRVSQGGGSNATNNPPLYYLAQSVPYLLGRDLGPLDRLWLMRLFGCMLAAVAALAAYGFVREVLPGSPRAAVAGGIAAGVQPMFAFIAAGVNNDGGLLAASALTFYALARVFRRGLDVRSGVLVGLAFGLGAVTKVNILGLAPGLAVAALVLALRAHRAGRLRPALGAIAATAVAVALPVVAYLVAIETVWDRPLWTGGVALADAAPAGPGRSGPTLSQFASYLWQFYLPRLPSMEYDIGPYPLWHTWFAGFFGRFGWLDTTFPAWAVRTGGVGYGIVIALAGAGLWRGRDALRGRVGEALAYAAATLGLLGLIALQGYRFRIDSGTVFEQGRYLMPLLALYALVVALAVRAAGERRQAALATVLALAALAHGLFAQVLVIGRFYG